MLKHKVCVQSSPLKSFNIFGCVLYVGTHTQSLISAIASIALCIEGPTQNISNMTDMPQSSVQDPYAFIANKT